MLDAMRRGAVNWLAKVLLGLLIIAFALWGVADVFRDEWPRLVATLVRDVGDLTIAEDAAQDAFIEASTRWPVDGVPERPGAWMVTTGRR